MPTANCSIRRSPKPREGDLFHRVPGLESATWKATLHRTSRVRGPDFRWFCHSAHDTRKDFPQPYLQGKIPELTLFSYSRCNFTI
jgi:hypothetical protein